MYGKNEVAKQFLNESGDLLVHSVFATLQGEGPQAGQPAVFVRLAKCNLRCYFCDTDFAEGEWISAEFLGRKVIHESFLNCAKLVVITGGEPLLQNIVPLVQYLNSVGYRVSVETAGTVWNDYLPIVFNAIGSTGPNPRDNLLVCSPKTPVLNEQLVPYISAYKYIVTEGAVSSSDGLPIKSTQSEGREQVICRPRSSFPGTVPVYIQPMDLGDEDRNRVNLLLATEICMKHGYNLSVQIHKLVNLP